MCACRSATGTNLGPIHTQPPTGQAVSFSGVTLMLFDEVGRIQESLVYRWVALLRVSLAQMPDMWPPSSTWFLADGGGISGNFDKHMIHCVLVWVRSVVCGTPCMPGVLLPALIANDNTPLSKSLRVPRLSVLWGSMLTECFHCLCPVSLDCSQLLAMFACYGLGCPWLTLAAPCIHVAAVSRARPWVPVPDSSARRGVTLPAARLMLLMIS
jgi:hypothetical protein